MQRRSATVYAVLFLVIAAGAYSLIGTAQQPEINVSGDTYTEGDTLTVNDREYEVASVGDGEGSLAWTNESAQQSTTWDNNSTTQLDNTTYRVLIPNESDPGQVTLREEFNLSDDVQTTTVNETEYVVVGEGENRTLVEVDRYLRQQYGEPETRQFSEGETFQYQGNETTVSNITADAATLTWVAPQTNEVLLTQGSEVELGPEGNTQTYVAHFSGDGVVLTTDVDAYEQQVQEREQFNERISGLWGIVILSAVTVILLVVLAFMPNK